MTEFGQVRTSSLSEFNALKEWAKEHSFTCPNGMLIKTVDYVYNWRTDDEFSDEEDDCGPRVFSVSDDAMAYFLIKYCPFQFVIDLIENDWGKGFVDAVRGGYSRFDTFVYPQAGTKFVMIKGDHFNRLRKFRGDTQKYWIEVYYNDDYMEYDESGDRFLFQDELHPCCNNFAYCCTSMRAVKRKIRKWKLPKGATVVANGRYLDECYGFEIK